MFTINIKGKENPKTPQLVKLEVILFKTGYARVTKILNITGPIKNWDNQSQQFKSKDTEASETNKRLIELKTKYLKVAEDWNEQDKQWSPVQWSHCFDDIQKKKDEIKVISVSQMFDILNEKFINRERIKNGKIITSAGTALEYRKFRSALETFTKQKYNRALSSYYFNDITDEFVEDFTFYTKKRGAEKGTEGGLSHKLRLFSGVIYYAKKINIKDADSSIFERVRSNTKPKVFDPKTIPMDVIEKIKNIDRSLFSKLEHFYIDLFLFSYYTGMANVDVCYLTADCIIDGVLTYERTKYTKKANLALVSKARDIIEKYQDKCFGSYMLPVFSHKHITEDQKRTRMAHLAKAVNLALRKVTKVIKYKGKITWYSARGTFITKCILRNYRPDEVAEMAGNSPNTIFKNYFKNSNKVKYVNQNADLDS